MNKEWGREESRGWPSTLPTCTIVALVIALTSMILIAYYRYVEAWTPLQHLYLPSYFVTSLSPDLGPNKLKYDLLTIVTRNSSQFALDDDVVPVTTPSGKNAFALAWKPRKGQVVRLEWQGAIYDNVKLHAFLGHWIYRDQTLKDMAKWPLCGGLGVFLLGLAFAVPKDAERFRELRYGRRLRGPELVTGGTFNRRNRSRGIGFMNQERSIIEKILGRNRLVRVPRDRESSHFLMMGDTGGGKSSLIRQMLIQIEERGEIAIVYDPEREYTPQFYNPARGDVILNPLDARMPYWTPGDEARNEPETLTVAASLFPDRPTEQRFFMQQPRELFAHLQTFKPTPHELASWMAHDEEIDKRVKGTPLASAISPTAPGQRQGIMAELKTVAKALELLPYENQTKRRWNTIEWARKRRGWIFLTTTKTTRERLLPLISLWIDLLVLRLMDVAPTNDGFATLTRVWFILDELASLRKLPQLHAAITQGRKSNNPVILGFQGRSQLEVIYGHEAEAMLSQPATKIFLRTSEPRAAKWVSECIGEVEIEQLRESRGSDQFPRDRKSKNYQLERHVEPLVMASEITGLPDKRGYLKSGNLVVRLRFPFIKLPQSQPALIERTLDAGPAQPSGQGPTTPTGGPTSGGTTSHKLNPHEQKQAKEQVKHLPSHGQGHFFD
jgi:type IV secretory pathway TraG/TraD family ATPase VirD4